MTATFLRANNDSGSPIGKCFPQEVQQAWWQLTVDDEGVEVTEAVAKRVEMTGALDRADTTVTVEEDKAAGTGLHRSH